MSPVIGEKSWRWAMPVSFKDANTSLGVGVIGLGIGEVHAKAILDDERCRLEVVCDQNSDRLRQVADSFLDTRTTTSPLEVINDPAVSLVCIATFDDSHASLVVKALDHGKDVFVEKPLCISTEELKDIQGAIQRNPGCRVSSNLILRRAPRFIELKRRIDRGDLGHLYFIQGAYDYGRLHKITSGWRAAANNYSVMSGGGIHIIDLALWLSGQKVTNVVAFGNNISTRDSAFIGMDLVAATAQLTDGSVLQITANFGSVTPHHHLLRVYGTDGSFEQSHGSAEYMFSRDRQDAPEILTDNYPRVDKSALFLEFVSEILGQVPPSIPLHDTLHAMAVSLAVDESVRTGNSVIPIA
jgi:predicted dehydrogenase